MADYPGSSSRQDPPPSSGNGAIMSSTVLKFLSLAVIGIMIIDGGVCHEEGKRPTTNTVTGVTDTGGLSTDLMVTLGVGIVTLAVIILLSCCTKQHCNNQLQVDSATASQATMETLFRSQHDLCTSEPMLDNVFTSEGANGSPGPSYPSQRDRPLRPLFGCGCGKCTFYSYVKSGCPDPIPIKSSFTCLNMSGLTDGQREKLRSRLRVESQDIMFEFAKLLSKVYKSLCEQKVPLDTLVTHLLSLGAFDPVSNDSQKPLLKAVSKELQTASSIEKVLFIIRDYTSFFNYHVIEHIVDGLGTDQDRVELQNYKEHFHQYCERRIYECPLVYGPTSIAHHAELVLKVDSVFEKFTVVELENFRCRLSKLFSVSSQSVLRLCQVEEGCMQLVFQVPLFVQEEIFPLSIEQERALPAEGVIRLTCGDYQFDAKGDEDRSEPEDTKSFICSGDYQFSSKGDENESEPEDSADLHRAVAQLEQFTRKAKPTGRKLGSGTYGTVIELISAGEIVAGKVFKTSSCIQPQRLISKMCGELSLMAQVQHPNVVQCKGVCLLENETLPVLLMESLRYNLHAFLLDPTKFNIRLVEKHSILHDVTSGLNYLHSHTPAIIHRDLTAKNVLLDSELRAKISDFGNARIMDLDPETTPETFTSLPGTREYMPPEAEGGGTKYDPSLDVFSFGHLSLFTIIQSPIHPLLPSTYPDADGLLHARSEVKRRKQYLDVAERLLGKEHSLVRLVRLCLHNQPAQRPRTAELEAKLKNLLVCDCSPSKVSTSTAEQLIMQVTPEDDSEPKFQLTASLMKQIDPTTLHVHQTDETAMQAVQLFSNSVVVILHTCNEKDFWAALERLEPPTTDNESKIRDRPIIYPRIGSVIGWFAGYRAAVVRTGQGNKCRDGLMKALTESFPDSQVIIAAGIAYANDRKRNFADVLVSDQIENLVQYKKEGDEITCHGPREEVDPNVKRIFVDSAKDWTGMQCFICAGDNRTSVAHIGCIVSAPTLIKDEVLRDRLMKHTPNAIGGEMEGWVLLELKRTLKSQHKKDIEVIIIKGVADYGDLKKGDKWQWTAAKAAIDCIHYCLSKSGGIEFGDKKT